MTKPSTTPRTRILIWDLPTRLFHWLLAASILGAFAVATLVDDEGALFPWHMLLGAAAAFLVALRAVWGLIGSRYARFGSFAFGPAAVLAYGKGIFTGRGERHLGHNPGSSVAIFAMLALTLGLAATGALMSRGGEVVKELHEVLAYALMGVVALHVVGIVVHTLRHRENITRAMIDGRKEGDAAQGIRSAHPLVALAFLALTAGWVGALVRGYDAGSRSVALPGLSTRITLGEAESSRGPGGRGQHHDDRD